MSDQHISIRNADYMECLSEITHRALKAESAEYIKLIEGSANVLASEKNTKNFSIKGRVINAKPFGMATIIGDLHGDLESLIHILEETKFLDKATQKNDVALVFLGDYGDRGSYSPEVYYIILKLKQIFPQKIFLLRGNHEGPDDLLAYPHDLPENLQTRFGKKGLVVYSKIRELFQFFYSSIIVNDIFVLIHGGIPSRATSADDLRYAHEKHPKESNLEEILWSDPAENIKGTFPSPRGAGRLFGEDVTKRFLELLNVRMLIRGHEPAPRGYKINHGGKILTLFSRKGSPYFNSSAAYLQLDLSLKPKDANELIPYVHTF